MPLTENILAVILGGWCWKKALFAHEGTLEARSPYRR
jgi:hypothetical protein